MVKRHWLFAKGLLLGATVLSELLTSSQAIAETGLHGSYVGIPVDMSTVLRGSQTIVPTPEHLTQVAVDKALQSTGLTPTQSTGSKTGVTGAHFQGRYDMPNSPVSLRGSVYLSDDVKAMMPTVTYDIPVGGGTNVYAGAGMSVVSGTGKTPLGDRTGMVMTTGVESEIGKGLVLYGDAKWLPGDKDNNRVRGNAPVRYQLGVGYRF